MPALFRRRTLNPRVVPTVPVEVDWTHPLAANLIGLYIPYRGGTDLCGNGPPLFPQANTTFALTGDGPGASSLTNTSGMASAVIPTRFQRVNTNLALVHVGWHTSTTQGSTSESCIFGLTFSGATYLPFTLTTNAGNFHYCNNNGANFATFNLGGGPVLGLNVVAVTNSTAGVANSLFAYRNGTALLSAGSTGVGNVNWTGGPNCKVDMCYSQWTPGTLWENCISLAGMIFDFGASPMPATIAAWLAVEPFAMVRPIVRRSFISVPTGLPPVTGTLTVTHANQTVSATGGPAVGASLSTAQAAQTLSGQGRVTVSGVLAVTQAAQTLSGQANVIPVVSGSLSATQASQTLSAAAMAMPFGALSVTQAPQTLSAAGRVSTGATLSQTQADQTLVAAGKVPVYAALLLSQANQTLSAYGSLFIHGTVSVDQADQTLLAGGTVGISSDAIHISLSPPIIPLVNAQVPSNVRSPVDVIPPVSSTPVIHVHVEG